MHIGSTTVLTGGHLDEERHRVNRRIELYRELRDHIAENPECGVEYLDWSFSLVTRLRKTYQHLRHYRMYHVLIFSTLAVDLDPNADDSKLHFDLLLEEDSICEALERLAKEFTPRFYESWATQLEEEGLQCHRMV